MGMLDPLHVSCETTNTIKYIGIAPPNTTVVCIEGTPYIPAPTYN